MSYKIKCIIFSSFIFILCFNTTCFILLKVSQGNSQNIGRDSFVSKMAFWIIKYVAPSFLNYLCIFIVKKYKVIFRVTNDLLKINQNIKDLHKINSKHILIKIYVCTVILSFILLITLEVVYNNSNFLSLWCAYVPSVIVNMYIALNSFVIEMCAIYLEEINQTMKKLSSQPLIDKILGIQNTDHYNKSMSIDKLFHNFKTYDKMYNVVSNINNVSGFGIVIYLIMGMAMGLSVTFSYITKNDLTNYKNFPYEMNFSREYCLIIFLSGIFILTYMSHYLQSEANKTGSIVYELINLYPDVNEEIILHGLQILNQKIEITAAGLFTIDFDITPENIILFLTHLSVFIQINEYYQ